MNFTVPFAWGAPDQDENASSAASATQDPNLAAIIKTASALSSREKALVLVLIQTISAWGGLEDQTRSN